MQFLRLSVLLLTVLSNGRTFAQNETNHWYFGYKAGLDFSGGVVVADTNGVMFQLEGCAAVSDSNGDLLFYTNGVNVWDAQHATMPNGTGLHGNYSATQSAVIVKKPFSDSLYYIFTVDAYSTMPVNDGFLSYSIVDMSLNSGWGDVTVKNEQLYTVTGEKLTAVRHCNETDYWIISCRTGTNGIYAYLLTKDGLSNTPVISNIGSMWSNQREIGYLKTTIEGDRLGAANKSGDMYEIMDFDRACGIASNSILLPLGTFAGPWGLEFSSDGSYFYGSGANNKHLYQYNLNAGTANDILNTAVFIDSLSGIVGGMQWGKDGKIYVVNNASNFLGVINDPDAPGLACNFVQQAVDLKSGRNALGIPNFPNSYFDATVDSFYLAADFGFDNGCINFATQFEDLSTSSCSICNWSWDFGDPLSGDSNQSDLQNPVHAYGDTGTYQVSLIITSGSFSDTLVKDYHIGRAYIERHSYFSCDSLLLGGVAYYSSQVVNDTLLTIDGCDSLSISDITVESANAGVTVSGSRLIANTWGASYQWLDCSNGYVVLPGDTSQIFNPPVNGNYALVVAYNGCTDTSRCLSVTSVGMENISPENEVTIYPNPNHDGLVHLNLGRQQDLTIRIFTADGRLIYEQRNLSGSNHRIQLAPIPGIYLVEVTGRDGKERHKLVMN